MRKLVGGKFSIIFSVSFYLLLRSKSCFLFKSLNPTSPFSKGAILLVLPKSDNRIVTKSLTHISVIFIKPFKSWDIYFYFPHYFQN